ncbi:hypothetical protein KOY48_01720 [Candidatus Minimicrobia naudis]|uniref:Uncharacterized protein n=1 Tax=Candidatus Minimicrobia naudis TaxID=2841263 RepID=A0A8F1MDF6_9BACT|nr:hypothetical protein KOY48_01720 [Candidatus Minimicrobia naudis]
MKKSKNYGARVEIDSLINGEVDNNSLFTLLTDLKIREDVFDMRILLASRSSKCTGHEALADKHLASRSTSIGSPHEFPYDRTELRSWRDGRGVHSVGGIRGGFRKDAYFSSDNAEYLMRRVAAVAVGLCLETPLQELDSVKEFSAEELAEAWPRLRYGIYI